MPFTRSKTQNSHSHQYIYNEYNKQHENLKCMIKSCVSCVQLDGKIIAPTDSKAWGSGLFQWLEFTKLVGITIKGSGTVDGSGSVWWQNSPLDDPIDDELKLIIPLNRTKPVYPPISVITLLLHTSSLYFVHIHLSLPSLTIYFLKLYGR